MNGLRSTAASPRVARAQPATLAGLLDGRPSMPLLGMRILLVQNRAAPLTALSLPLQLDGAEVTTANSAVEALDLITHSAFDIALCDVALAGMSGYEFFVEARRRPRSRSLPAIALSAGDFGSDLPRALASGFSALLARPVRLRQVLTVIAMVRAARSPDRSDPAHDAAAIPGHRQVRARRGVSVARASST